mmetsp:Transcript_1868/g.2559  ORF Transcript_1868/g.2559 Transcript_1868/m.2559 type:complete len:139 (-) Transcript_1868:144-560(-)
MGMVSKSTHQPDTQDYQTNGLDEHHYGTAALAKYRAGSNLSNLTKLEAVSKQVPGYKLKNVHMNIKQKPYGPSSGSVSQSVDLKTTADNYRRQKMKENINQITEIYSQKPLKLGVNNSLVNLQGHQIVVGGQGGERQG